MPIAFHGDGVACIRTGRSGSKSLDVFAWHGLLFQGATLFMKHLIMSVFTSSVAEGTMDAIWKTISWSFYWMYRGLWPDRDEHDVQYDRYSAEGQSAMTPLAGGYFAVLWTIKGDLKFFVDCFFFYTLGFCTSL